MKTKVIANNYFIVSVPKVVTAKDVNAYSFTNTGTNQVVVQGETIFPNETLSFPTYDDEALDWSTYEVSFPFPQPGNSLLVKTRKVRFLDL